jgi:hypothetical protein
LKFWQHKECTKFLLGDLWCLEEFQYGERKAMAEAIPYAFGTLMKYGYVARHVAPLLRSKVLSFSHHEVVAPLKPDDQIRWLDIAAREKPILVVDKLKQRIKDEKENKRVLTDQEREWQKDERLRHYLCGVEDTVRACHDIIFDIVPLFEREDILRFLSKPDNAGQLRSLAEKLCETNTGLSKSAAFVCEILKCKERQEAA